MKLLSSFAQEINMMDLNAGERQMALNEVHSKYYKSFQLKKKVWRRLNTNASIRVSDPLILLGRSRSN